MPAHKQGLRTVHFVSLGCPKNRVDTEVMAGVALERGLRMVSDPSDADVIVVNTCAFIEAAREESVDVLLEMARHRTEGRAALLVSAGCLSQRHGQELALEMPELTHLLGTGSGLSIGRVFDGTAPKMQIGPPGHFLQETHTPRFCQPGTPSAYLKLGDGCSRRCAFCAIPGIRGRARSRPLTDLVAEAERLADLGVKELCLVAQDTSAYGRDLGDGTDLVRLIRQLDRVSGIAWVRLLYLYPDAIGKELLKTMRDSPKVVAYFDLPIQHASAKMLRRMRRGHGPKQISGMVTRIRETLPEAFLRTTILVGHPGESEQDFRDLLAFLSWARFEHLGALRYSEEVGTASYGKGPAVPRRVSYNRLRKVMALGRRISRQRNRQLRGQALEVLIEAKADPGGYVLVGRHRGQAPEVDGATYVTSCAASPGDIVPGRVVKTGDYDLVVAPI